MEQFNDKILLSIPPISNYPSDQTNALYYRSIVDRKEYMVLLQSDGTNQSICKYDIATDRYTAISPSDHNAVANTFPAFKDPNLCQIITEPQSKKQLLIVCTKHNHLAAIDLSTNSYTPVYQSLSIESVSMNPIFSDHVMSWIFAFFLCFVRIIQYWWFNNSFLEGSVYAMILSLSSFFIARFAASFEEEIKYQTFTIPEFEMLSDVDIATCYIAGDGIHFVSNHQNRENELVHFKLDETTRCFIRLKPLVFDPKSDGNIKCYKLVHVEHLEMLMLFTTSSQMWTYDLIDNIWSKYEEVMLPRVPGPDLAMNVVVGFKGIVFLFYYKLPSSMTSISDVVDGDLSQREPRRKPSEDSDGETDVDDDSEYEDDEEEEEEVFTYCWDTLFTGDMFECESRYNGIAVNTKENWTHFLGEDESLKKPNHFKIALSDEIPMELIITHMAIYHTVIKQYIMEAMGKKIASNIELQILEFFPMFL